MVLSVDFCGLAPYDVVFTPLFSLFIDGKGKESHFWQYYHFRPRVLSIQLVLLTEYTTDTISLDETCIALNWPTIQLPCFVNADNPTES